MKQRKVLVFEAYPFFSGAQRVSLNLCKILKQNNFHITLLLADDSKNEISKNFGPFVDEIIKLEADEKLLSYGNFGQWFKLGVILKTFFTGLLPFYWSCIKIFNQGKFDFFYFCDPRGAVMLKIPLLFFRGKKIMYLQSKNRVNPFLSKLIFLSSTDYIVSPSIDVMNSLPPSSKKMVINYGIDSSQYSNINTTKVLKEIYELIPDDLKDRKKILYAGLIKPQKGVHHIIYSLEKLKNKIPESKMPIVFILGEPKSELEIKFKLSLKSFIKEHNLSRYIIWVGWKDNVLEWMRVCDYFVFPTIDKEDCTFDGYEKVIQSTEGSPLVLIESSLCQLFAIASDVTGVKETIVDYQNGLVYDPSDPNGLVNCFLTVINREPTFAGFPTQSKFSLDTFSTKFLSLFK